MYNAWYESILKDAGTYVEEHEESVLRAMLLVHKLANLGSVDERLKYLDDSREELGGLGALAEMFFLLQKEPYISGKAARSIRNSIWATPQGISQYLSLVVYIGLCEFEDCNKVDAMFLQKRMLSVLPSDVLMSMELKFELMSMGIEYNKITPEYLQHHMELRPKLYCVKEEPEDSIEEMNGEGIEESKEQGDEEIVAAEEEISDEAFLDELDVQVRGFSCESVAAFQRISAKVSEDEWRKIMTDPTAIAQWLILAKPESRHIIFNFCSKETRKELKTYCRTLLGGKDFKAMAEKYLLKFVKAFNQLRYGYSSLE